MTGQEGYSDQAAAPRRRWYIWDAMIVAVTVLCGPYLIGITGYVAGLRDDPGQGIGLGLPIICGVWPLLVICLALLIVRMVLVWPKRISNRRRLWFLRVATIGVLVVCVILPFTPLRVPGPPRVRPRLQAIHTEERRYPGGPGMAGHSGRGCVRA